MVDRHSCRVPIALALTRIPVGAIYGVQTLITPSFGCSVNRTAKPYADRYRLIRVSILHLPQSVSKFA